MDKEDNQRSNGRWTQLEHQNFLVGLQLFGKNWKKIQELIGTRTGSQIRSHAQKFFLKTKKSQFPTENSSQNHNGEQASKNMSVREKQEIWDNQNGSFFMSIIDRYLTDGEIMDFWGQFIDIPEIQTENGSKNFRKNSFVSLECKYQEKNQTLAQNYTNFLPLKY